MLSSLKQIPFIILLLTSSSLKIWAQITYIKELPRVLSLKERQVDPDVIPSNDIYKYYLSGKRNATIYYTYRNKNKIDTIHSDSLSPKIKNSIDTFIIKTTINYIDTSLHLESYLYKTILNKIDAAGHKQIKNRSQKELNEILYLLKKTTNSKETIWLNLQYADLNIHKETYYEDFIPYYDSARYNAGLIVDLYDRGLAYRYIGEFAANYEMNDLAIEMYYVAKECIYNSKKDRKTKYSEQGSMDEKMAELFVQKDLNAGVEKRIKYYLSAIDYYKASGEYDRVAVCYANYLADCSYLVCDHLQNPYSDSSDEKEKTRILRNLEQWYHSDYSNNKTWSYEYDYLGLQSIAMILSQKKEDEVTLIYYLDALRSAVHTRNDNFLYTALYKVALQYSVMGKEKLALNYVDLEVYLASKTNNELRYYYCMLDKGDIFLNLNKYDSALFYVNRIEYESSIKTKFFPFAYNELLERTYHLKYNVLDALRNYPDSPRQYERYYTQFKSANLENFTKLLQTESNVILDWLNHAKNKEISTEKELEGIAEKNKSLQEKFRKQAENTANSALKEMHNSDSLASLRDTLAKKSEDKRIADNSLNSINEKLVLNQKEYQFRIGVITIISLLVVAASIIIVLKKTASAAKAKNLAEFNRVNELAKNKIHNIENDYSEIGNLIAAKDLDKLELYNTNYESFLAKFLENWKKNEKTSLEDELTAFERYFEVKKVIKESLLLTKKNEFLNPEKVRFVQSIFDTLLDNSIKHGFKYKKEDCSFSILITKEEDYIVCTVTDNGKPSEPEEYLVTAESGLNILKNRIANFYKECGITQNVDYFKIYPLACQKGTQVKIKLPYAEI